MIVDMKTGRIAFHAIQLQESGPTKFVQYDFEGKVLYEKFMNETNALDYRLEI